MPFIGRMRVRNFRSIAKCDVHLDPLTVLVGPNGSGKSNFLQALAFLGQAVRESPSDAVAGFGGWARVIHRVPEPAASFSIEVEASLPPARASGPPLTVRYGFELGPSPAGAPDSAEVLRETCEVLSGPDARQFSARRGIVQEDGREPLAAGTGPHQLYLRAAAGRQPYRRLLDGLAGMRFFNLAVDALRVPSSPTADAALGGRGENLGNVLAALAGARPGLAARIDAYLNAMVPEIGQVGPHPSGGQVSVNFRAAGHPGLEGPEFTPDAVSDGTVRAAGVLGALFQLPAVDGRIPLIGIENPEAALHPAAAGALLDALTEASGHVQVIVPTHSADLLDRDDADLSAVRVVRMQEGRTQIGWVDMASRRIVEDGLCTLGELMRGDQLIPAPPDTAGPGT